MSRFLEQASCLVDDAISRLRDAVTALAHEPSPVRTQAVVDAVRIAWVYFYDAHLTYGLLPRSTGTELERLLHLSEEAISEAPGNAWTTAQIAEVENVRKLLEVLVREGVESVSLSA